MSGTSTMGSLTKSDLHLDILRRFRAAGIEMASPQVVLRTENPPGKP